MAKASATSPTRRGPPPDRSATLIERIRALEAALEQLPPDSPAARAIEGLIASHAADWRALGVGRDAD